MINKGRTTDVAITTNDANPANAPFAAPSFPPVTIPMIAPTIMKKIIHVNMMPGFR